MSKITLDYSGALKNAYEANGGVKNLGDAFASEEAVAAMKEAVLAARKNLVEKSGAGNDFVGWVDLPFDYDKEEFARIKAAAEKIKNDSKALVVIGIGGSYLGARAVIEFLQHTFCNPLEIYYVGNNMSSSYIKDVIDAIGDKDFSVNVISKSGTTTEPAIAFRIFKGLLEKKYGAAAKERIYATTDKAKGALKTLADAQGYETFVVPDDVGGRYSVLTAVGLLPIAAAGLDVDALIKGAQDACTFAKEADFEENDALLYAAVRNVLYKNGKKVEILCNYEPSLHYVAEWWKQLYGESEGKGEQGIFPAAVDLTTDLHSMGQYIQDGERMLFETVLNVQDAGAELLIEKEEVDLDGLNYLAGKSVDFVNKNACQATIAAHIAGGVPNMVINLPKKDAYHLGYLLYTFEFACGVSGYVSGINPFDQPGVEFYKKNMFRLLGKPGAK